jgi:NAD(P)-dependent dehydrogenase (short-subunit alcohol dehydrogenase family)
VNVLVTGASGGIGSAVAARFLADGHTVAGLDRAPPPPALAANVAYRHLLHNLLSPDPLPDAGEVNLLVCCAGVQGRGAEDIDVNLKALVRATERYGVQPAIRAICLVASASAHTGAEFPEYAASKGGVLAYAKNVALRVARWGAVCNSISPGGVLTDSNRHVTDNPELWARVMEETPLKRWATPEEIAEWIHFLTVVNRSMTGQDVLVDNGEAINFRFVW